MGDDRISIERAREILGSEAPSDDRELESWLEALYGFVRFAVDTISAKRGDR